MIRTIGVEEESLLVDVRTGRAVSVSDRLLAARVEQTAPDAPDASEETNEQAVDGAVEGELQRQQIETQTPPVATLAELDEQIRLWRRAAHDAAQAVGARVAAIGTAPLPVRPITGDGERYQWLAERFQASARDQLICGCHVHVAIEDDEEGVAVLDRIRVWLPVLLALSSNSPFWDGGDTGFASYRNQLFLRWPSTGPSDVFGAVPAYRERIAAMVATGVILDEGMVYLDARLAAQYPTVEIRAADVCLTAGDAVLIAALCRAMVHTAAQDWRAGKPPADVPSSLVRFATWQASRHGAAGDLLDPFDCTPRPAWEVVADLETWVRPALEEYGDLVLVREGLDRIRVQGTGAQRQRQVFARTGRLIDVVARSAELFTADE